MDNLNKVTKKQLIDKVTELSKKFNIDTDIKTKDSKASLIQEYKRILLVIETKKTDKPAEMVAHILSKKDARKAITQANKETKSLSGLIRILKEFKKEYQAGLSAFSIDIDTLTPKIIKELWKKDYIKDGVLIEDYRKKNPLYSETDDIEAQRKGIKYLIPTHVSDTRPVESFTVNKLIKYCAK